MSDSTIRDNLMRVRERIARAAARAGRDPSGITLVCVSKTKPAELVREALEAGATDFGENYVQEAAQKVPLAGPGARWHMIGHLQTNKAARAAELFHMIQSVDSVKLAGRLGRAARERGRILDVLIEVNVVGEQTKSGAAPEEVPSVAEAVLREEGLRLLGVMGIPPFLADPERVRPYFAALREIFETLPPANRRVLSMGMSADFEAAIAEGSTMVRIGTAVFGAR
jgi:hypothetical protein